MFLLIILNITFLNKKLHINILNINTRLFKIQMIDDTQNFFKLPKKPKKSSLIKHSSIPFIHQNINQHNLPKPQLNSHSKHKINATKGISIIFDKKTTHKTQIIKFTRFQWLNYIRQEMIKYCNQNKVWIIQKNQLIGMIDSKQNCKKTNSISCSNDDKANIQGLILKQKKIQYEDMIQLIKDNPKNVLNFDDVFLCLAKDIKNIKSKIINRQNLLKNNHSCNSNYTYQDQQDRIFQNNKKQVTNSQQNDSKFNKFISLGHSEFIQKTMNPYQFEQQDLQTARFQTQMNNLLKLRTMQQLQKHLDQLQYKKKQYSQKIQMPRWQSKTKSKRIRCYSDLNLQQQSFQSEQNLYQQQKYQIKNYINRKNQKKQIILQQKMKQICSLLKSLLCFNITHEQKKFLCQLLNNRIYKKQGHNFYGIKLYNIQIHKLQQLLESQPQITLIFQFIQALKIFKCPYSINFKHFFTHNLKIINISQNNLTNIQFVSNCQQLQFLNLNHNRVKNLNPLRKLTHLIQIHTLDNFIQLPFDQQQQFYGLRILDIGYNQICDTQSFWTLKSLKCLKILNIIGNPIQKKIGLKKQLIMMFPYIKKFVFHQAEIFSDFNLFKDIAFFTQMEKKIEQKKNQKTLQILLKRM